MRLKLDYDHDNWFQVYQYRMRALENILGVEVVSEWFYKSEHGNHHVEVEILRTLKSPLETIILQLILGSDPIREMFNYRRVLAGQKNWNVLFEHKEIYIEEQPME